MGELKGSRVYQSRIYLTGKVEPEPNYDYEHVFPITIYEAIRRSEDEHSATLLDELNSIYRLIKTKQDIIEAGIAGRIMTWTGVRGQIGSMEVVRSIAADPINRSHAKIPSERAIGDLLDSKMSRKDFNEHVLNSGIHVTEDEKERWNSMAPLSSLNLHIQNEMVHVTGAEKKAWNAKADGAEFAKHVTDTDNPHNTTAHQVGTYSRREIDDLFANLRESFFTYLNIVWDTQINVATLEEYDPDNWNPNFILEYGDSLPEVSNPAGTYFALIPATDNKTNETQDCIIYIKLPGMTWQEVGFQSMKPGDMVIKYPEALMYVWVQGKFTPLFAKDGSSGGTTDPVPGTSNILWKPYIDDNGELAWKLATADDPPETMVIRGYTPQKGVDYFDGKDGEGVPKGGIEHDILVKSSDNDYDTEWKDLLTMLREFGDRGGVIPKDVVVWENIKGAPKQYDELGENIDGYMTQKSVTDAINGILDKIQAILDLGDIAAMQQSINAHLMDYQNPHHVAPDQIGAVSIAAFVGHTQNFDNPHLVTAAQLGLGSVDNTRDIDKPISNEMQHALDELWAKINSLGVITPIDPEDPDAPVLPAFRYVSDVKFTDNVIHILFSDKAELNVELPEPIINNPVEKIFCSARFDRETNELVIIREDESEDRFSLVTLVQVLTGSKGDQINIDVTDDNRIIATLKLDSVTGDHLIQDIHLRGNPTTTTQDVTDKSTRLATTEWVKGQVIDNLISYEVDRPLSANMGRILNQRKADITDVIKLIEDIEGIDIIDDLESTSPVAALSANMGRHLDLTKAPRVHTSPSGSTFGQATKDVFGHVRSANEDPLMDGLVSRGEDDGYYARQKHRHPTDKSRAPVHWPDEFNEIYELTGEPRAVMPPDDSNDNRIATTEWIRRNAVGVNKGECHTRGSEAVKVATLRSTYVNPVPFMRQIGSTVSITFTNEDKSGKDITMLDVNETGAAQIIFAGAPVTNGMIGKKHEHMFVFDGENWRLINPVPGTGIGGPGGITIGPGRPIDPDEDPDDPDKPPVIPDNPDLPLINEMSGHSGLTVDIGDSDEHGRVNHVWIGIQYSPKVSADNVEVTFATSINAWAIRMGDGTYLRVSNPTIISKTETNTILQFDLERPYASNSPCQLVYRTELAWINIKEV